MESKKLRLARLVKLKRSEKAYTQSELAEKTKLSLRSIQRIEKGEVMPRAYTLNALSQVLDFSLESVETSNLHNSKDLVIKKIIFSNGGILILPLIGIAYLMQAADFPETPFERVCFWIFIISLELFLQWWIWVRWKVKV